MAKAKQVSGIDCQAPALDGIRLVLQQRFDEMCQLRGSALKWKDSEGVHSMRVASRRLRSAANDFLPFMNKRAFNSTLKQIKGIADGLGEVRDLDVAIMALEKLTSDASSSYSPTLNNLIDARKNKRKEARKELNETLGKSRLEELEAEFATTLSLATTNVSHAGVEQSYINVARTVIRERLKELEKLSSSLYRPAQVEPLHEMRIAAKGLRYAIELFSDCWDASLQNFAKETAHLQTALGKLHDCDNWVEGFEKEIYQSRKQKVRDEGETYVWLFTHFSEQRSKHFQEAFSLWKQWEADATSPRLIEALKI